MTKNATYESPQLVAYGKASDLTLAASTGAYLDADWPEDTPATDPIYGDPWTGSGLQ